MRPNETGGLQTAAPNRNGQLIDGELDSALAELQDALENVPWERVDEIATETPAMFSQLVERARENTREGAA